MIGATENLKHVQHVNTHIKSYNNAHNPRRDTQHGPSDY